MRCWIMDDDALNCTHIQQHTDWGDIVIWVICITVNANTVLRLKCNFKINWIRSRVHKLGYWMLWSQTKVDERDLATFWSKWTVCTSQSEQPLVTLTATDTVWQKSIFGPELYLLIFATIKQLCALLQREHAGYDSWESHMLDRETRSFSLAYGLCWKTSFNWWSIVHLRRRVNSRMP